MNSYDLIFALYFLVGLIMTLVFAYYLPAQFIATIIGVFIFSAIG